MFVTKDRHDFLLASLEIVASLSVVTITVEIAKVFGDNGWSVSRFATDVFATEYELTVVVLSTGSQTVTSAIVFLVFVILAVVIRATQS